MSALLNEMAALLDKEREKGFREGIEAAAKVAETAGPEHYARQHNGMTRQVSESEAFIARSIRAISPAPQSRGDDDDRADALFEGALIGGNHLACFLINKLGGDFADRFPPDMDPQDALRVLCATDSFDVWCCWAAIMRARDARKDAPASAPTKDSAGVGGEG